MYVLSFILFLRLFIQKFDHLALGFGRALSFDFGEGKPTEGLYTVAWKGSAKNGAFEHLDFKGVDDNEGELFSGYINIC